ncbi:DUF4180 domain-containing protein [Bosea sp. (in: a-proteobacteria)]|jgi:hypothetical protein|uniref:DUF4180 domain-containing protein n=1 Tax=Bosea sp. (in: a-proteobacteria) TaxID=1871050 RepID=UPI003F6F60A7
MDMIRTIHGTTVLICSEDGPRLESERDIGTFLGAAWDGDAALVAIPVARLSPDFFQLSTRLAGEVAQKFVNYRMQLAIIGDISARCTESKALRDFVYEANRGRALWFVDDLDVLQRRLESAAPAPSG